MEGGVAVRQRILYIDPWAGVAGDMLIAALLDLDQEVDLEAVLRGTVGRLAVGEVGLEVERVRSRGIAATRLQVVEPDDGVTRGPAEAQRVVAEADLPSVVAERSIAALQRLAQVEAAAHDVPVEEVHFHELGAVDTLVDVVGGFALWHALGCPRVVCGPLPLGAGQAQTAHGLVGVPAPATVALCRGVPVRAGAEPKEVTTPTGALMATELADAWGPWPAMRLRGVGYGAGWMELEHTPNVVRVALGDVAAPTLDRGTGDPQGERAHDAEVWPEVEELALLETVVDDCSGEQLAYAHRLLMEAGALDAWLRPVIMKKGRPGTEVCVLAAPEEEEALVKILGRETGTLGVRRRWVERWRLERSFLEVKVEGRPVRVKVGWWQGEPLTLAAEYEDAAAVASELGRSLQYVMSTAVAAARSLL